MIHWKEVFFVLVLAAVAYSCQGGFDSGPSGGGSNSGGDGNLGTIITTTTLPGATTTTAPVIIPPSTTVPKPPGGAICCPQFSGCFSNYTQLINYANATGNPNTCINVNGRSLRGGFGPCIDCTDPNAPTTTTTTIPTTTTTTVPGWPTSTTQPGAG